MLELLSSPIQGGAARGQIKKHSQGKTFLPSLWQADVRLVVAALRGKTVLRQRAALSTGP